MNISTEWIKVSEPYPHVFHVELAREPVNAFSERFWREFGSVFHRLGTEVPDVRVAVLSSAIPKLFTAGLDINNFALPTGDDAGRTALSLREFILNFQRDIHAPERCPFPVIVACHGNVIGLGVDIISACDIRYAASNSTFTIKEVDIGLAADIGTLSYLPKIAGNHSLIRELAYTARPFSAEEAEKAGIVSRVVQGGRNEVVAAALDLAQVIATKSPVAIAGTKQFITHSRDHSVPESLEYTATWNAGTVQAKDVIESLQAVKQKRKPMFSPLRSKL